MEDALNVVDAAKQSRPSAEEVGAALENGEITYCVQPIFDLE